jgi:hypothetical protein
MPTTHYPQPEYPHGTNDDYEAEAERPAGWGPNDREFANLRDYPVHDDTPATTAELCDYLREAVMAYDEAARMMTFGDAGLMCHNDGLVITFPSGAEFQVTLVQSRIAEGE